MGSLHQNYLWFCFLFLGLHGTKLAMSSAIGNGSTIMAVHEQWMAYIGRTYKSFEEKEYRLKIFKENLGFIRSFNNNASQHYKLAINRFADLTNEEFKAIQTGFVKPSENHLVSDNSSFRYENMTNVPLSMDWRRKGAVTPIKNQGGCGSCWAFAAVAAIEGIVQIKEGTLLSLSEQEILACDHGNHGCSGGFAYKAFKFVVKKGGLSTEADYPYETANGTCKTRNTQFSYYKAKINGYERVPANNERQLAKAVANQPVVFAIDCSGRNFQFYAGGIFTGGCGTELNHEVAAIGYGEDEYGTKYWILKNSWGTGWGENGYMRILRDVKPKGGMCGIAMDPSYPTI